MHPERAVLDRQEDSEADRIAACERHGGQVEGDTWIAELVQLPLVQRPDGPGDRPRKLRVGLYCDPVHRGHEVRPFGERVDGYALGRGGIDRVDMRKLEYESVGAVLLYESPPLEEAEGVGVVLARVDVETMLAKPSARSETSASKAVPTPRPRWRWGTRTSTYG